MKFIDFALCFFLTGISVFSCSSGAQVEDTTETTKIIGRVHVFGSVPHTFVGIVNEAGIEYAVYPHSKEGDLVELQGYLIEFSVIFPDEPPQTEASLSLTGGTVTPVSWVIIR